MVEAYEVALVGAVVLLSAVVHGVSASAVKDAVDRRTDARVDAEAGDGTAE
ncbi:hypothetical protein [Halorarum halobium]|uniref:hypothetical protein n=1 Tax=Halorarum halobium TaxID=3075121 RepID=UPI0028A5E826|nr:hypothetical protein [Halobaculum sp. XH14]